MSILRKLRFGRLRPAAAPAPSCRRLAPRLEALEDRLACTANPVTSLKAVTLPPNSEAVQLEFTKTTLLGPKDFTGSGILIAPNWVLTAAHNLYGSGGFFFASKVVAHPGQTAEKVGATERVYRPFGEAVGVHLYVPAQWMWGDENYDIGLVELDRNIGSARFAGRMDYGWLSEAYFNQNKPAVRMNGYPAEESAGYHGNFQYASAARTQGLVSLNLNPLGPRTVPGGQVIRLPAAGIAGAGGSSGSGVYVDPVDIGNPYWGGNARTVVGVYVRGPVNPKANPYGEATRITPELFDWINSLVKPVIKNNRYTFPDKPGIDKPDLMAYDTWFSKHLRSGYSVQRGSENGKAVTQLKVQLDVWNGGTAASKAAHVQFYLTQDPARPTAIPIGKPVSLAAMGPLNRNSPALATGLVTLPTTLRKGTYYVGWRIIADPKQQEFTDSLHGGDNNVGFFQWVMPLLFDGKWSLLPAVKNAPVAAASANGLAGLPLASMPAGKAPALVEAQAVRPASAERTVMADLVTSTQTQPAAAELPASAPAAVAARDALFADFDALKESLFTAV
jgi:V8-like Glu-specific endopeptidase